MQHNCSDQFHPQVPALGCPPFKDWVIKASQASSGHVTALLKIIANHMNNLCQQLTLTSSTQVISVRFYGHNYFSVIYLHPQSPDCRQQLWYVREKERWIMNMQLKNVQQQLCDAIKSRWTDVSKESFQHLV